MKILLVSLNHSPEQTGIGKFQGEMADWFVSRGHDVRAITAPPYYPEWRVGEGYSSFKYKVEEIAGAKIFRVPLYVPSRPNGIKRLIHLLSFAFTSLPIIFWQALAWKPDAIIATAPPIMVAPTVLLASWISGARSHIHVQDFEVDAAFNLGLLTNSWLLKFALGIERFILRAFSAASSISVRMRERLLAKGVSADKAFLIPNWAGIMDFDANLKRGYLREGLGYDEQTTLAVYSGNMGRKQGLEVIVEAARKLKNNANIQFVISGDGAVREEMMSMATDLNNIRFLPVQPLQDFIHLMVDADIHLLPQKAEAADLVMPSKLGNILASGRPVVAGAYPDTQLYNAIEGCGIAVTPDDVDEFANAILLLASSPELRQELGNKGRKRALDEWSRDGILLRLESILNSKN